LPSQFSRNINQLISSDPEQPRSKPTPSLIRSPSSDGASDRQQDILKDNLYTNESGESFTISLPLAFIANPPDRVLKCLAQEVLLCVDSKQKRDRHQCEKEKMTPNARKLVLVKGAAGLGNRILSLLTASLFAVAGNRRLLIDWRDPTYSGHGGTVPDLFADLFVSPLADPLLDHIAAETVAPTLWKGRLDETLDVVGRDHDPIFYKKFGSFRQLAVSLRRIDYQEDVLVFWSFREVMRPLRPYLNRLDSRYRSMSNQAILKDAAQKYLQPNDRVRSIVNQFTSEHFQKRMLGLHIRATDLMAPVEKLLNVASRLVKQHQIDGVFVATDNADVEVRARNMLPNVITLPKQLPKGGIPLHYDPECQNRLERATQALVDMILLSQCTDLVYASRSSFGYVASLFSPLQQVLVDVDRFNPKIQGKQYIQSWIY
jgi:hypothetical protein